MIPKICEGYVGKEICSKVTASDAIDTNRGWENKIGCKAPIKD